jgi:hypothetical protein
MRTIIITIAFVIVLQTACSAQTSAAIDTTKVKFWTTGRTALYSLVRPDSSRCKICKRSFEKWDYIVCLKTNAPGPDIAAVFVHLYCVPKEKSKAKFR